jgi:hypothetical protein
MAGAVCGRVVAALRPKSEGAKSRGGPSAEKVRSKIQTSAVLQSSDQPQTTISWSFACLPTHAAMGTAKKEANRKEREGKTGDGMGNVRSFLPTFAPSH